MWDKATSLYEPVDYLYAQGLFMQIANARQLELCEQSPVSVHTYL